MLKGSKDEVMYHSERASNEIARASQCEDAGAAAAHRTLATFHETRVALAEALRKARHQGSTGSVCRTDKES